MQKLLESRAFLAGILAISTGAFLFYTRAFPDDQIFLRVIAIRAPQAFLSFRYLYYTFLFTTPYLIYSTALSGLYIFTLKARPQIESGRLPLYPDPRNRDDLFVVVGEVHHPRKPVPAKEPQWLTIPERGLFTGIAIFGAVGSGKTSCCMFPFAEQILAYRANDAAKRIGGLILEVKGDFCRKVKDILDRHGRSEDYIEIGLDSEYRYNPLHNDLDAYALAYNIASLLNNLYGRGKEPFWQQAYTNLVKFVILLHKVAFDYVTLFDVYECTISPSLLEARIEQAREIVLGRHYVTVPRKVYSERANDVTGLGLALDAAKDRYTAPDTPELRETLRRRSVPWEALMVLDPKQGDPDKVATTGKESSRSSAPPSSRGYLSFSLCSMTTRK